MINKAKVTAVVLSVFCLHVTGARALSEGRSCQVRKLNESAKYGSCRLRAELKGVRKGTAPDFTKCESKFAERFSKAEAKAGLGICQSEHDQSTIDSSIKLYAANVATLLAGGVVGPCGDARVDMGEQCDEADLAGADCTTLGFTAGTLACLGSCRFDTSGCTGTSRFVLVPGVDSFLPLTGQNFSSGAGTDGAVLAGYVRSYTDNGDGTITDNRTGLIWEKKDDSGGIHDKDDTYTWCAISNVGSVCDAASSDMDGTMVTEFLNTLNDVTGGGASCFAGRCDWRIPNVRELSSIIDYSDAAEPSVNSVFHHSVTCTGCTDVTLATCSCTVSSRSGYWSSTTYPPSPRYTIAVSFEIPGFKRRTVVFKHKFRRYVRAVSGGL